MRKEFIFVCVVIVSAMVIGGCGHSGESGKEPGQDPKETVKSADEVIKEAENTAHLSGDADEDSLYNAGALPFGGALPAFLQTHTADEFPSYDGDAEFFVPVSDDYLILELGDGKTAIYEFFHDGSLLAVRGRTVYDSQEALLQANPSEDLKENQWNESGFTYSGNVLYSVMSEEAVFAMSTRLDKFKLLKTAASGAWDGDLYWFSKPYDDYLSSFDTEKWDNVLTVLEQTMPNRDVDEPDEQESGRAIDEETVRTLFNELMEKNGKTPADYEESDLKIVMNDDTIAYASLFYYTVPETYVPGDKVENFLISAPLSYDESADEWTVADQKTFFEEWKSEYYHAILTDEALPAFERGAFVKRFWVPFRPADPVLLKGVVYGRVMEVYEADDGELAVTVLFSNGTGNDARITTLDSLVLTSPGGTVADVSASLSIDLPAGGFMYETLLIPAEYLVTPSFTDVNVQELKFSVEG